MNEKENAARLAAEFAAEEAYFERLRLEKEELDADSSLWPTDQ